MQAGQKDRQHAAPTPRPRGGCSARQARDGGAALGDPSAAIALLWMRRSFAFAVSMMRRLLLDAEGGVQPALRGAYMGAYAETPEPYHGGRPPTCAFTTM